MPQLSKTQVRTLVRELIDDTAGKLWSTTSLDLLIEGVLDELWGELLDHFPFLNVTKTALLTPDASGIIDLAHTNESTSTALIRYHRIISVSRDGVFYQPADPREIAWDDAAGVLNAPDGSWWIQGNALYLYPTDTTVNVRIVYNAKPEPFTSLSTSSNDPDDPSDDEFTFVVWPDGYHLAYIYDVASRCMEKGDREESKKLKARAEESLFRLRAFLRKQTVGPMMPFLEQAPEEMV